MRYLKVPVREAGGWGAAAAVLKAKLVGEVIRASAPDREVSAAYWREAKRLCIGGCQNGDLRALLTAELEQSV